RFGGGEQERTIPSRFLKEVPPELVIRMGEDDLTPQVNLDAERFDVRQAVKRTTYTGKTYNSVENISQFFAERGLPPPPARTPPVVIPRAQGPVKPLPPPTARRGARTGMTVEHPKYGTGTVVRREGEGDDAKITVSFPGHGLKKLVEKY